MGSDADSEQEHARHGLGGSPLAGKVDRVDPAEGNGEAARLRHRLRRLVGRLCAAGLGFDPIRRGGRLRPGEERGLGGIALADDVSGMMDVLGRAREGEAPVVQPAEWSGAAPSQFRRAGTVKRPCTRPAPSPPPARPSSVERPVSRSMTSRLPLTEASALDSRTLPMSVMRRCSTS